MQTLPFSPTQTSYSVRDGKTVVGTELDGGAGRYRRDILNATSRVSCRWQLNVEKYFVFRAFFKGTINEGADPFLCEIVLDSPTPEKFVCRVIPGTMSLSEHSGLTYIATAEMEVEPYIPADGYYETVFVMYRDYGNITNAISFTNILEKLVNVDFPGSFYE